MTNRVFGAAAAAVTAFLFLAADSARAVDAPKWVAAIYMEAQKSIGLRWMPAVGATGYKVLRSTTKGSGYVEVAAPATPQHFDKAVEGGTTYYYVLQAAAGAEASPMSEEKTVTIPGVKKLALVPPKLQEPAVQSQTEFGKVSFKVLVSWDTSGSEVVAYNVYRTETAGKDHQLIASVAERQYVDATALQDKTYYYAVSALDGAFLETKLSEEKAVTMKAPEEKEERKEIPNIPLAMRPSKELFRVDAGYEQHLAAPVDLVQASNGDLYVLNAGSMSVSVFGADGTFKKKFGKRGSKEDEMGNAFGIGIDADDNVYVVDGSKILAFNADGNWQRSLTLPPPEQEIIEAAKESVRGTPIVLPYDVAETIDGNLIVSDNGMHRMVVIDKRGKLVTSFGSYGNGPENLKFPVLISVNSKGEICVGDAQNRRVVIYTKDYAFKVAIGEAKTLVGAFIGLAGSAADDNDDFIIVDPPMATLQFFSSETGKYLYHLSDERMEPDKSSNGQRPVIPINNPSGVVYNKKTGQLSATLTQLNQLWAVKLLDRPAQAAQPSAQ